MKYTRTTNNITLEFTQQEYNKLMFFLGWKLGGIEDLELGREFIEFVDEMNVGNEDYRPYIRKDESGGGK